MDKKKTDENYQQGIEALASKNYKEALKFFDLAAEQGLMDAQYELSKMYKDGIGVPKNYKTALKCLTLAAEQGHLDSQFNLGLGYKGVTGIKKDIIQSLKWFNIAAANGHENAQQKMASLEGQMNAGELEESQKLASEWFNKHKKN